MDSRVFCDRLGVFLVLCCDMSVGAIGGLLVILLVFRHDHWVDAVDLRRLIWVGFSHICGMGIYAVDDWLGGVLDFRHGDSKVWSGTRSKILESQLAKGQHL